MFDTLRMKVSMEGAWKVSEGRAFQSFTVRGKALRSSEGFFNIGFATAVLKSERTVPEASGSFRLLAIVGR